MDVVLKYIVLPWKFYGFLKWSNVQDEIVSIERKYVNILWINGRNLKPGNALRKKVDMTVDEKVFSAIASSSISIYLIKIKCNYDIQ